MVRFFCNPGKSQPQRTCYHPLPERFFIANVETRAIPYVDLVFMWILILYLHTHRSGLFLLCTSLLQKSTKLCLYIYIYCFLMCVCVYHKVCYLLVVFLRCPHSNPESSSQHVGQADGLKIIFPLVPLQIPFVLVLKGISHGKIS